MEKIIFWARPWMRVLSKAFFYAVLLAGSATIMVLVIVALLHSAGLV